MSERWCSLKNMEAGWGPGAPELHPMRQRYFDSALLVRCSSSQLVSTESLTSTNFLQ